MADKSNNIVTLQAHLALHNQLLLTRYQQETQWTILLNLLRMQKEQEIERQVESAPKIVKQTTRNISQEQARC